MSSLNHFEHIFSFWTECFSRFMMVNIQTLTLYAIDWLTDLFICLFIVILAARTWVSSQKEGYYTKENLVMLIFLQRSEWQVVKLLPWVPSKRKLKYYLMWKGQKILSSKLSSLTCCKWLHNIPSERRLPFEFFSNNSIVVGKDRIHNIGVETRL